MEKSAHMLTVGDFVLNTDSRKLFDREDSEVSLPPTLFALLKYFIEHQNEVLSKEMIISNVWKGKIVVEANINQNIKKLRDILGDSASDPKYIETVTGEGFRFIANSEQYKANPRSMKRDNTRFIYLFFGAIFVISLALFFYANKQPPKQLFKQLYQLTTLKGIESHPEVSSDKKYLLFSSKNKSSWDLYLKPIDKESYHLLLGSDENETAPSLSVDQTRLLYTVDHNDACRLMLGVLNIKMQKIEHTEVIKKCEGQNSRIRGEWHSDEEVFISYNSDLDLPASIYHYNLREKTQTLISKPSVKGFGDYALKFSQKYNKLAYVRDLGWSSSEIWVYDLATATHRLIKSTPIMLRDVDWGEDGMIYFQSAIKELSRIHYDGKNEEVIAQFSSNLYVPFVIDAHTIGVAVGEYFVIDIGEYDISNNSFNTVISSRYNDYFGAKAQDFTAFVSNRSGDFQVWVRDHQGNDIQVTRFNTSYEIRYLSVFSRDNLIMFSKSSGIEIIDVSGNSVFKSEDYSNNTHNNPVFDSENSRFIYSVEKDGEWVIESRSLNAIGESRVIVKGISARPCYKEDCIYYFKENDPYLYKYTPQNNSSEKLVELHNMVSAYEWDVFDEGSIIYLEPSEINNQLKIINLKTKEKKILYELDAKMFSYDRATNSIYTSIVSQGNTDLMRFSF